MSCINCNNNMAKTSNKTGERNFEVIQVRQSFDEPLEATTETAENDTNVSEKERLFGILDGLGISYKKTFSVERLQELINNASNNA